MRERLTVAFALVALVMVGLTFAIRSIVLTNHLRAYEGNVLQAQVGVAAGTVRDRESEGEPVTAAVLAHMVPDRTMLIYHVLGHRDVTATGAGYGAGPQNRGLWAVHDTLRGTLVLEADPRVIRGLLYPDWQVSLLTIVVMVLLAGGLGYLVAARLARPFRMLAEAAADLGRGRFELRVPRSGVSEVHSVAQALEDSAAALRDRLTREQALAEHTSHALRTPLTALRLELEDLRSQEDLPTDVAAAVDRSIGRIEQLDGVTAELVSLARGSRLVSGAEITLRELATATTQRWADELAQHGRSVTASVEGDLETTYTPGPVEQILDLVLVAAIRRSGGPVRLVYEAAPDAHLRIAVEWTQVAARPGRPGTDDPLVRARAVATALGGRLDELGETGVAVRVPRR